jgi:hypothetical protein
LAAASPSKYVLVIAQPHVAETPPAFQTQLTQIDADRLVRQGFVK